MQKVYKIITGLLFSFLIFICCSSPYSNEDDNDILAPSDTIFEFSEMFLISNGVGPSWIKWDNDMYPEADIVFVDEEIWEIKVMSEFGLHVQDITLKDDNVIERNFPLDEDGLFPDIHWKGDPEAHPTEPIIFFKAENENTDHVFRRNSPSVGWENDIWSVNIETGQYSRLTSIDEGHGVQHSALSDDGHWYVYPLRYYLGMYPFNFGYSKLVFNKIVIDDDGNANLDYQFEIEPNGQMYYEPIDIRYNGGGQYTLLYVATSGLLADPYRIDWNSETGVSDLTNVQLLDTPDLHEEFTMYSPSGNRIVWMQGPGFVAQLKYQADLYLSKPDFTDIIRLTEYNLKDEGEPVDIDYGAQISRLTWKPDGSAVIFGVWHHEGALQSFARTEIKRIDFSPAVD